tara:strand:+ start:2069 stop:2434 length:366 start_codon:yes stop_codon:yes gene_type:complete
MSKLLETKLPIAIGEISPETFNRLVRVLELSLNGVDVDATQTVNFTQRDSNKFNDGDIIWNKVSEQLQLWTGEKWINLYVGTEEGVGAVGGLGVLSVSTNGNTIINITAPNTGYNTDTYYT